LINRARARRRGMGRELPAGLVALAGASPWLVAALATRAGHWLVAALATRAGHWLVAALATRAS